MAGTWAGAKAAIVTHLNGLTADAGTAYAAETLTALPLPPSAPQTSILPYCYVIPPEREVQRGASSQRVTVIESVTVRCILGGQGSELEAVCARLEAWVPVLTEAFDDAVTLDGNCDVMNGQSFSGVQVFEGEGWGFEMELDVRITEDKAFSA